MGSSHCAIRRGAHRGFTLLEILVVIALECEPNYAIATSAGPDSTFGTGDDVKSEEP